MKNIKITKDIGTILETDLEFEIEDDDTVTISLNKGVDYVEYLSVKLTKEEVKQIINKLIDII